jgi:HAD superfamily hydrolase (TIGR01549 family)
MDTDLVIFDKDGTLIDVHYYWGGMVELRAKMLSKKYIKPQYQEKATYELMSNMGISLETKKIKSTGPVGIKPREYIINTAYQVVKQYFDAITIEQVSSVFKEIDVYSQTHLSQLVKPLPGVEELLATLKQQKIKIAIATTDLTSRAKLAMDSIGLTHYFDCIAGADLVDEAKPSADLVNYLCDKMACEKSKTLVVGDSIVDLRMAESAQVDFIGVKTGLYSPEFLAHSQTLVDDLIGMEKLI